MYIKLISNNAGVHASQPEDVADRRLADLLLFINRLRGDDRVRQQTEARLERADERVADRNSEQHGFIERRHHRLQRQGIPEQAAVQAVRVRVSLLVILITF